MDEFKQKQLNAQPMMCDRCAFIYDPRHGDPESNIEPCTNFEDIPENWVCPICDASKDHFKPFNLETIQITNAPLAQ